MRAVGFREHGGLDRLVPLDVPKPEIGSHDVLVRVKACALNHLDLWVREGLPGLKLTLPHIPGCDVAGEVAAVGNSVSYPEVGTRVAVNPGLYCGECEWCIQGEHPLCPDYRILGEHVAGGYADFVAVPARNCVELPTDFEYVDAAAAPLVFETAWRMLITRARVRAGESVLVLGAGSGVSTAAIQIAKLAGCTVFAASSSDEKLRRAKEIGADVLINSKDVEFDRAVWELTAKRGVDVVVDHIGPATFAKSLRALTRGGRLVFCGATSGPEATFDLRRSFYRGHSILGSTMSSQKEFEDVMALVFRRKLTPVIDRTYPLEKARDAQERLDKAEQFGKIVLTLS
ncbi:MAG: zinc-binding dehydrogenase [Methanobacteriota archaeon]|nr:MAG: zinc-binding dehydrogenase [Euryarchaeota archaeon]